MMILVVALLVCVVIHLQPQQTATPDGPPAATPQPADAPAAESPLYTIRFPWVLSRPVQHACVLQSAEQAPTAPEDATAWVQLGYVGDELHARIDTTQLESAGLSVQQRIDIVREFRRRQPSGKWHTLRHLRLACGLTDGSDTTWYLLELELDAAAGTADTVPCDVPADLAHLTAESYTAHTPTSLPEKFDGSEPACSIRRLAYALAAVDSAQLAKAAAPELYAYAWSLARKAPAPEAPWPRNWGDQADEASAAARLITPTLVYLQEHNCFDCEDLASFINSPTFSTIFGSRFTELPTERLQEEDIPIIFVKEGDEDS